MDRVNDNTCDCHDGSDEPGTAACAFIDPLSPPQPLPGSPSGSTNTKNALPGFWCANEGHVGSYLPFSYVNDGVCDYDLCCDGSDEFAAVGGVKCENRCGVIGREHRRLEEEKRKNRDAANHKRKTMQEKAAGLRRRVEDNLAALVDEIKVLEARKVDLQSKHAAAELEDKGKVVRSEGTGGKLSVLLGLSKKRVTELRETLQAVVEKQHRAQMRIDELETILRNFKEEYNPNFNDEGVKAAVKSFEDYSARQASDSGDQTSDADVESVLSEDSATSGVNWSEFEEEGEDTDICKSAARPPTRRVCAGLTGWRQCTNWKPTCPPS